MPIYEYNCQDCKQIFEEWQKDYEERDLPCPVCGGQATRLISSSSFVLKGGGWYASGYSAESAAGTGAGAQASPAPDAKPAESAPAATPPASTTAATS